jgi:MFS family permease
VVIFANVLLGASQGLAWSSTVVMKIDLVGDKERGLAMGLNEFAGYFAVGVMAFVSGWLAFRYGVTPYPFYVGIGLAILGLMLSWIWVKDTRSFVEKEAGSVGKVEDRNIFLETTLYNKTLSSVTQAGLVNNLNDGMIWGLLPLVLMGYNFSSETSGILTALYPAVWGIGQLFTGKMADTYSRKKMLFWGMLFQGIAIIILPFTFNFYILAGLSIVLGLGTALVYPTFLVSIAAATHPKQRAESIGTFRLWRDLGYAIGAVVSGIIADLFGLEAAIVLIGILTLLSAGVIQFRMPEKISLPLPENAVDLETLRQRIVNGAPLQIIDVRNADELTEGFIPNSIHIPLNELEHRLHELNPDALIVTACTTGFGRSEKAAELLQTHGFQAKWLLGGTYRWLGL